MSDVKEHVPNVEGSHHQRKRNYTSLIKENIMFKKVGKATNLTPLKTRYEQIWSRVLHLHNIPTLLALKADIMGHKPRRWCNFHRVKGHPTKYCHQFKKKINRLIQEGRLKKYVKGNSYYTSDKSNSQENDTLINR